jgi:D-glycero-D-manno-heptose 1,7-bisphosphate phosphatase
MSATDRGMPTDQGDSQLSRAVFLDRDGVINRNAIRDGRPVGPATLEDFVILPGVREAAESFRAAGYLVIVATNQPLVAPVLVEAMHSKMRQSIRLDDVKVCTHADAENCACRKPKPGLLLAAAKERGIALAESWMIGDRWRDVEAGKAAGCRTIFIDYGYTGEPPPRAPDHTVGSLLEAVPLVIGSG